MTVALVVAFAGTASADTTLGSTARPAGAIANNCHLNTVHAQEHSDPSTPYTVPGPGTITQWQTNAVTADGFSDPTGRLLTFVVLKADTGGFSVVGADSRPIPGSGSVVNFPLSTPIAVSGGETLGLYTGSTAGPNPPTCFFRAGSTPTADSIFGVDAFSTPAPGQTLPLSEPGGAGGFAVDVSATFVPTPTPPASTPTSTTTPHKKKCKKKHKKASAEIAKKRCKKKKK